MNPSDQELNQELEHDDVVAPLPDEIADKPESLRETIEKARETVKAQSDEPKEKKEKVIKVKSHQRVVGSEIKAPKIDAKEIKEAPNGEAKDEAIQAPQSYSSFVKAKWAELPKEIQQELSKRENDYHKELTKHDEERNFGRQMKDVVTPYVAQIRAEGAEPAQAVASLLNMAHVLRVGSPQQKSDLLIRTAQTFGVDLRQALQVQQMQPQLPPQVQQAMQEVQSLKLQLQQQEASKKQQEDNEIQGQIKAFAADSKNIHFDAVKPHMAALLKSGVAKDLQDAYDQAVYANPQTRSSLLEAKQAESNEKRVAEQKARAEAAKRAGSSLRGAPGIMASKDGKVNGLDLRQTIRAAIAKNMDS